MIDGKRGPQRDVTATEAPGLVNFLVFNPPGIVRQDRSKPDILGILMGVIAKDFWERTGQQQPGTTLEQRPDMLVRLLAKIAHGALSDLYRDGGYRSFLPDLILGRDERLFEYVGGNLDPQLTPFRQGQAHKWAFGQIHQHGRWLHWMQIRLFAYLGDELPVYTVIAGEGDGPASSAR